MAKDDEANGNKDSKLWCDLTAYWFLGLCNNYGYVVMLSAAYDIISQFSPEKKEDVDTDRRERHCHIISPGVILMADILPSFLIKLVIPFLPFWVRTRICIAICCSAAGFFFVAFAPNKSLAILGVVVTSASCGIGESTFLAYSSHFNKNVISTWSSGTGGAGIIGSVSYAALKDLGVSSQNTILIMLCSPCIELIAFFFLLRNHENVPENSEEKSVESVVAKPLPTVKEKFLHIENLLKYMLPLALVYFFEYFINKGLFELVYYDDFWMSRASQYRWLSVDYQVGVFISRSSVNLYHFRQLWTMAILQGLNATYFLCDAIFFFTPSIWITFLYVFWEGLLGGAAYVNTFYRMSYEVAPNLQVFSNGFVANSDSYGISLAELLATPIHNLICKLPAKQRPP